MSAGRTFIARWPIHDPTRDPAALRDEAAGQIGGLAAAAGVRITGHITWTLTPPWLLAEADAVPLNPGRPTVNPTTSGDARRLAVWWLTRADLCGEHTPTDAEVADRLGISLAAVAQARATPIGRRTYRTNAASTALRAKVAARTTT